MDDHVIPPALGKVDQGVIFNGAQAENYPGKAVHGLFITARCDIANDKARIYNYLPIVSLRDWLIHDGRIIFCERAIADTIGNMKSCLKQCSFSESILETEPPLKVLNTLFPSIAEERNIKRGREQFEELVERLGKLETLLAQPAGPDTLEGLGKRNPKILNAVLRDLMNQQLTGYYFFSSIEPKGEDSGFVVLLREIHYLPQQLVTFIARGIGGDEYGQIAARDSRLAGRLVFDAVNFLQPIGRITSPRIEHLMQAFSSLFSRIGITDITEEYRNKLWDNIFK